MNYCDDFMCKNLLPGLDLQGDCALGFKPHFKMPNSWTAVNTHEWGFVRPTECKHRFKNKEKELFKQMGDINRIDRRELDRWITREPDESTECDDCEFNEDCDGEECKKNAAKESLK